MNSNSFKAFRNVTHCSSRFHSRRTFLRATGVGLSLSWLDAMQPAIAQESSNVQPNLPVLLFGGGFKHGQHLAFDPKDNTPLANPFVSMLQRMGMKTDRFGTGNGTLIGLEFS